ncbi:MAG: hypothetical protein HN693_03760 [Micrococcales bacterium]|nr:hypothetical protein [Micrococcales bacterium]MBT7926114.1 hypothetical protein [Micrococcales bacterium]
MFSVKSYLTGVMHPEGFHGQTKTKNYFEGWYFKFVSDDLKQKWAVIPGVFLGLQGSDTHEAFVQVLNGTTGESYYVTYPIEEFEAAADKFEVRVGPNRFSARGAVLDVGPLKGEIKIESELVPWPVKLSSPGIMGWYGMVPMMECFHGLVSFNHKVSAKLEVDGKPAAFSGKGYIEKDWGKNFPSGYIWLHSNHLENDPEASLVASAAIIPWLNSSFRGFIMGFHHSGKLHAWTTYNKSKELDLKMDDTHVHWSVTGEAGTLTISALRARGGLLHAPLRTAMHQRVEETMDSVFEVKHEKDGVILKQGTMKAAAMEVFGDIERLLSINGK